MSETILDTHGLPKVAQRYNLLSNYSIDKYEFQANLLMVNCLDFKSNENLLFHLKACEPMDSK